jgi:hypothetical protein
VSKIVKPYKIVSQKFKKYLKVYFDDAARIVLQVAERDIDGTEHVQPFKWCGWTLFGFCIYFSLVEKVEELYCLYMNVVKYGGLASRHVNKRRRITTNGPHQPSKMCHQSFDSFHTI